jgi:hypothetical protein
MKATINPPTARTMNSSEPITSIDAAVTPTLIKKKELAKRLSVSTRSIDGWVAKRMIPYIQITPRFYLYEFDAVLAALKKHYQVEARG